jgi:hypothetical protein
VSTKAIREVLDEVEIHGVNVTEARSEVEAIERGLNRDDIAAQMLAAMVANPLGLQDVEDLVLSGPKFAYQLADLLLLERAKLKPPKKT